MVCDDPKVLRTVVSNFIDLVFKKKGLCIKKIVRIKNGFKNLSSNMPLHKYNYQDIKINVLIEYNNMSLIAEIQFLIKFMVCN